MQQMRHRGSVAFGLLLALGLSACVTADEGQKIREDLSSLQRKLGDVSARSDAKVQELDRILKEATRLLGRSSADVGVQVGRLRSDLDKLIGRVEQVAHDLGALTKQVAEFRSKVDVSLDKMRGGQGGVAIPADKDQLFAAAQSALQGSRYDEARKLAWAFLNRFGKDPKAAQMQLLVAESYFSQGQFGPAAGEYQKVIDYYPRSPVVPDAILKIGVAFFEQKDCAGARAYLTMLLNKHPRSRVAGEARNTLRDIQRVSRNRKRCTS